MIAGLSAYFNVSALLAAMGAALLAAERFPEHGPLNVATVATSTILVELFGPFWVKRLVVKSETP